MAGRRYANYGSSFERFLRRKHAEGWSDPDIADAWGGERRAVARHRQRLELPSNAHHPRQRRQWAKMLRDMCADRGVSSLGELRSLVWRERALSQGWPAECSPVMCQILEVLEYGPKTRREICAVLGRAYHPQHCLRNGNGQTLTAILMSRGYITPLRWRSFGKGKGSAECLYTLAPGFRRRRISGVG